MSPVGLQTRISWFAQTLDRKVMLLFTILPLQEVQRNVWNAVLPSRNVAVKYERIWKKLASPSGDLCLLDQEYNIYREMNFNQLWKKGTGLYRLYNWSIGIPFLNNQFFEFILFFQVFFCRSHRALRLCSSGFLRNRPGPSRISPRQRAIRVSISVSNYWNTENW